jgi:FkbM family methyltransferase
MKHDHLSLEEELNLLLSEDISSVVEREKTDFDRLVSPFEKSLVLVGAGNLGRQVLARLRRDGIEPLAFADNNPTFQGKSIEGVHVLSRQQAAEKFGSSAAFIVTIWNTDHSFVQTRKELAELNCQKVLSAVTLRWKYPESLLPFFWLDIPSKTVANATLIKSAFSLWSDRSSRQEYLAQMKFRILGEFDSLSSPVAQASYFPDDLFDLSQDEKFIDCGAFDGITVKDFLERQKNFAGRVVAYEPDPNNFEHLKEFKANLAKEAKECLILLPYAVGAKHEKVHFDATGTMGSAISNNGKLEVECVMMDESLSDLKILPTYIKMDIEGSELAALSGARNMILKATPILAICLYHRYNDLWRIPLFIHSLGCDYKLFLRPHEIEGWQLVCYAVPLSRLKNSKS